MKFKVGQKIRRIHNQYSGMKKGDTARIIRITKYGLLVLKGYGDEYDCKHDPDNFELTDAETQRKLE